MPDIHQLALAFLILSACIAPAAYIYTRTLAAVYKRLSRLERAASDAAWDIEALAAFTEKRTRL